MAVSDDASFNSFEISDVHVGLNGLGLGVKYKNVLYVITSDKVFETPGYTSNINLCYGNTGSEPTYSIVPSGADCEQKRYVRSKDGQLDGDTTCSNIFGTNGEIKQILNNIMNFIKYGGPILMLLLTIVDLVKTATSGEDKDFKKVFQNFIKRFIAAALLFFIRDIIYLLFLIVGIANPTDCIFD